MLNQEVLCVSVVYYFYQVCIYNIRPNGALLKTGLLCRRPYGGKIKCACKVQIFPEHWSKMNDSGGCYLAHFSTVTDSNANKSFTPPNSNSSIKGQGFYHTYLKVDKWK